MLPHSAETPPSEADVAACAALLRNGSRTFLAASLLLPARVRGPAVALYAFCRVADDAIDEATGSDQDAALAWLNERLSLAYAGRPLAIAADRALADVVHRFAIPHALPAALLEGFAWDAAGRHYETLSDLTAYAVRAAGTVGAMMAMLMGARDPKVVARACDLGVAMQFTNIARDVGEDAANGRLYLPRQWLREAGIDPDAWLARPTFDVALAGIVQRLLTEADALYRRAAAGIARLPTDCRPGITAASHLYAEIGRQIERGGCNSVTARAVVPGRRKLLVLANSLATAFAPIKWRDEPNLAEATFLVSAVATAPLPRITPKLARRNTEQRVLWVIALFDRLERQQLDSGRS